MATRRDRHGRMGCVRLVPRRGIDNIRQLIPIMRIRLALCALACVGCMPHGPGSLGRGCGGLGKGLSRAQAGIMADVCSLFIFRSRVCRVNGCK